MNTDQAKTLSENALTRLMDALDQGKSEVLRLYLAVMSRTAKMHFKNDQALSFDTR